MKTFRVIYWFNSIITGCYIIAKTTEEAEKIFRKSHKNDIVRITEE